MTKRRGPTVFDIRYYLDRKLAPSATFERKTPGASGFDLAAAMSSVMLFAPLSRATIRTGLYLAMPLGIEAQVRPRSGIVRDHGIAAQSGTVDSDYRGEISVTLINLSGKDFALAPGTRIAQLVFAAVLLPDLSHEDTAIISSCPMFEVHSIAELGETDRGARGFGSTGTGATSDPLALIDEPDHDDWSGR